jgi:hypothetical protein
VLLLSRMSSQDAGSSLAEFALMLAGFLLASSVVGIFVGVLFGLTPMVLQAFDAKKNGNGIDVTYDRVTRVEQIEP